MAMSVTPTQPLVPIGALTCAQCKDLLSQYVDGALSAEHSGEVRSHVKTCKGCSNELRILQAQEDLLIEALSSIKPSASHRGRVARMCEDVHVKAEKVANSLPDRGWAIFRWGVALAAFTGFIFGQVVYGVPNKHPSLSDLAISSGEISNLYRINALMFLVALAFLVQGHRVAQLKYWISWRWGKPSESSESVRAMALGPTRLENVLLHGVGLLGVIVTLCLHFAVLVM